METTKRHLRLTANELETFIKASELPFGFRVYYHGPYGIVEEYAAIGKDERGLQTVVYMGSPETVGNISMFRTLYGYTRPLSKEFGIGYYYDDIDYIVFDADKVKEQIEVAKQYEVTLEQRENEKARQNEVEIENLKKEYSYLTLNPTNDRNVTKKNMVALLKKFFPAIKFSVKRDYSFSYTVTYTNAIPRKQIEVITNMFVTKSFDSMTDSTEYKTTNFNKLFGGFDYVTVNREFSEPVKRFIESHFNMRDCDESMQARRLMEETNIPTKFETIELKNMKVVFN